MLTPSLSKKEILFLQSKNPKMIGTVLNCVIQAVGSIAVVKKKGCGRIFRLIYFPLDIAV